MVQSLKVDVNLIVFKWLRKSSGWPREDVSNRLRTSVDVIKAIEQGERRPTLRQLKELSKAYKIPLVSTTIEKDPIIAIEKDPPNQS